MNAKEIVEYINDVSYSNPIPFMEDKAYLFNSNYVIIKFIKDNLTENNLILPDIGEKVDNYILNYLRTNVINQSVKNFYGNIINLLLFSKIIKIEIQGKNVRSRTYKVINKELFDFISECYENTYIWMYLLIYQVFLNDGIIENYRKFCKINDMQNKFEMLRLVRNSIKMANISKGIKNETEQSSDYNSFRLKYAVLNLNYINNQVVITRTGNLKNKVTAIEDISRHAWGEEIEPLVNIDEEYIREFLKDYKVI